MQEMVSLEDSISYTFMSRNKRFIIEIGAEHLEGEGNLVDEFYEFKDDMDDPDILCDFERWAINAIHDQVKQLVPVAVSRPTTLLDYYDPEIHVFELFNDGGVLKGKELTFRFGNIRRCQPQSCYHRKCRKSTFIKPQKDPGMTLYFQPSFLTYLSSRHPS